LRYVATLAILYSVIFVDNVFSTSDYGLLKEFFASHHSFVCPLYYVNGKQGGAKNCSLFAKYRSASVSLFDYIEIDFIIESLFI